jgi:hypothetical protein
MNNPVLTIRLLWLGVYVLVCVTGLAQRTPAQSVERHPMFQVVESFHAPTDQELEMLKKDLRSQKRQIIAANLKLTDQEAEKFWPIYDQYSAEVDKTDDTKFALIQEYQKNYPALTDEQAAKYVNGRAGVDSSVVQLRVKYFPIFLKVLSGKKTALFFQIDRRLWLMIDLQIAAQNPLIAP